MPVTRTPYATALKVPTVAGMEYSDPTDKLSSPLSVSFAKSPLLA